MQTMGGFILIGPTFAFINAIHVQCSCNGFCGEIDAETEQKLLNKSHYVIDLDVDLPNDVKDMMQLEHLGDSLEFERMEMPLNRPDHSYCYYRNENGHYVTDTQQPAF